LVIGGEVWRGRATGRTLSEIERLREEGNGSGV
jgi:hypothetical protein